MRTLARKNNTTTNVSGKRPREANESETSKQKKSRPRGGSSAPEVGEGIARERDEPVVGMTLITLIEVGEPILVKTPFLVPPFLARFRAGRSMFFLPSRLW